VNANFEIEKTSVTKGFKGDVQVTVKVKDGRITSCTAVGEEDGRSKYGKLALEEMPKRIVEAGSPNVDAVTGATVTSQAIITAAQMAFEEAVGTEIGPVRMKPGKYTASTMGYLGTQELPVTVTVNETSFLKIEVPSDRFAHAETEVMLECVKEKLFPRMIETQSLNVDAIAGATITSNSVKASVRKALQQALREGGSSENAIYNFYSKPQHADAGVVEEMETDILVLGLGNGGIIAMVSAMEEMQKLNGRKRINILGIEKAGKVGGNSALTHEANAVNPPRYMAEYSPGKRFVDEKKYLEKWLEFTTDSQGRQTAKEEMVKLFVEESGKVIDWLHYEQGWQFGAMQTCPFIDFEAWATFNYVLTANKDKGTNEDRRKIIADYYEAMLSKVVAQGGKYLLETEAYDFIMDGDRVAGVKARNNVTGREYIIHAKAVIMGCGGFANNEEMLSRLLDERFAGSRVVVNTGQADGKMMQAALNIGAGTWNLGMSPIVMMKSLPKRLTHYPVHIKKDILNGRTGRYETWTLNDIPLGMGTSCDVLCVDRHGNRFGDESKFSLFSLKIKDDSWPSFKAGPYYYAIYSQQQVDNLAKNGFTSIPRWDGYCSLGGVPSGRPLPEIYECLDLCINEGIAWKADTLEGLAEQLGMDQDVLRATVDRYNAFVDKKHDDEFGKDPRFLTLKTEGGPYYAIKIMNAIFATSGGLDVDTQMRVLSKDHKTPIDGFYAIGCDSLGVIMGRERNYIGFGGVAQGWALLSGRLAGINAAKYVHDKFGFSENKIYLVDLDAYVNTK